MFRLLGFICRERAILLDEEASTLRRNVVTTPGPPNIRRYLSEDNDPALDARFLEIEAR